MKRLIIIMSIFNLMVGCSSSSFNDAKAFGDTEFSSQSWKSSNNEDKAKMVYSFLTKNNITNLQAADIYNLLGKSTAYYEYDEFPAYLIESSNKEYTLAFPVNRETSKIRKYIIVPSK